MSFRVRVLPSGAEFDAEAGDTLLEAGLRDGINFRYRCTNGTCGDCRARLQNGEVEQIGAHDFQITEPDRLAGDLLLCRHAARSDLVLEARLLEDPLDIPQQQIPTQIRKIEAPQPDLRIVHLRTPRSQTLQFLAGQQVTLRWQGLEKTIPLASCPCRGMDLELHFRQEDDDFSRGVFEQWARGSEIELNGPQGHFLLEEEDTPHALTFLAWDTDFAPVRSLIEHAIAIEHPKSVRLVWATAHAKPYLDNLVRSWADALEDFTYIPLDLSTEAQLSHHAFALALARSWHKHAKEISGRDVYIAGPSAATRLMLEFMHEAGDDPARILRLR